MLYRNFDENEIMDSDHYGKHVHAMTGESLHSKMDIAAELAFRDIQIEKLTAECDELAVKNKRQFDTLCCWLLKLDSAEITDDDKATLAKRDLESEINGLSFALSNITDPELIYNKRKELTKQAEGL